MNWKALLEGITAAAIGGAGTATVVIADGKITDPVLIGKIMGAGALIGVGGYFKKNALKYKPKPKPQQSDPPPDPGPQG